MSPAVIKRNNLHNLCVAPVACIAVSPLFSIGRLGSGLELLPELVITAVRQDSNVFRIQ